MKGKIFLLILLTATLAVTAHAANRATDSKAMPVLRGDAAIAYLEREGLYPALIQAVESARYGVREARSGDTSAGRRYTVNNPAQKLKAFFGHQGMQLRPNSGEWNLHMRLLGVGDRESMAIVTETRITGHENRTELHHELPGSYSIVEWFINAPAGLEHGFTIPKRPACRTACDTLQVQMEISGDLQGKLEENGEAILFTEKTGANVIRYEKLVALDAAGKILDASMAIEEHHLTFMIQDRNAEYPITIDPVFVQVTKLEEPDNTAGNAFGTAVAISGNIALVSSPGDDDNGPTSGSAYVFYRNQGGSNNWGAVKKLLASDGAAFDLFGDAAAVDKNTIVIGARGDDDIGSGSGAAYVFQRNHGGADNWGEVKKLLPLNVADPKQFGVSVAISENTIVVGTLADERDFGSAHIFERDQGGPDNWGETRKLVPSDGEGGDQFGLSVAIHADTAVVGSRLDDDNGDVSGSAYVFYRDQGGTDNWGEVKKLLPSDGAEGDQFGHLVAVHGDITIAGAPADDDNGNFSGSAYIFYRNYGGTDNWGEFKKLLASDGSPLDAFGFSVAADEDLVFVGAIGADSGGAAYIFSRNHGGSGNWGELQKLTQSEGASSDHFGASIGLSGNTLVVGAPRDDDNGIDSGSAYVYSFATDPIVDIDIQFCGNPNAFNCKKKGSLEVTVFGTPGLNVLDIDINTVQLCLAVDPDDPGNCVSAVDAEFPTDRGDPATDLGASQCAISDGQEQEYLNPDGWDDIDILFDAREVSALIQCSTLSRNSASPTLLIQGELSDGTPFLSVPQNHPGIDQLLIKNK